MPDKLPGIRLLLSTSVFHAFLSFSTPVLTAEDATTESTSTPEAVQPITPKFSVELEALDKMNNANETFWLDVGEQKTLVLKYWARGKVSRGHLVLLHAQGEHADHPRIMRPLARQFSEQGWHVYIPNLPIADYPLTEPSEASDETESAAVSDSNQAQTSPQDQASADTQPNTKTDDIAPIGMQFFSDESAYQLFISNSIEQLIASIQPPLNNILLLANQNSGYWVLDSVKKIPSITQVVLLEPQIPSNIESNLETSFNGQNLPVFTFVENNERPSEFIVAFDRQLWRSPYQRINRGTFSNHGIESEDTRISKLISGWVNTQQNQN